MMRIMGIDPNHYTKQDLKFHPIKFAGFCWCAKCEKLVDRVETDHPNGLDRGPWIVTVHCHGRSQKIDLTEEIVRGFKDGSNRPVPTSFFEEQEGLVHVGAVTTQVVRLRNPRILSTDEIVAIEDGSRIFDLTAEERERLDGCK